MPTCVCVRLWYICVCVCFHLIHTFSVFRLLWWISFYPSVLGTSEICIFAVKPLRRTELLVLFLFKSTKTEEIEVDWFVAAFCGLHCSGSGGVQICRRDSPLLCHSSPAFSLSLCGCLSLQPDGPGRGPWSTQCGRISIKATGRTRPSIPASLSVLALEGGGGIRWGRWAERDRTL